jgi:hypothetical protein
MFKRMFITFMVLVVGYAAFIQWVPIGYDTGQHLQGSNRIKAEGYLYGNGPAPSDVIVGSSLAFRMVADSLKPGTYNLAVGGLSLQEGLDIIVKSRRWPERVFIESNILFRRYDDGFMKAVTNPAMMAVREQVPMLRERNQPSGLLFGWVKARAKEDLDLWADTAAQLDGNTEVAGRFMLDEQLKVYAHVPSGDTIARHLDRLAASVAELETHGTEVVFFEMPLDTRLMEMPLAEASRAVIHRHFPRHRYFQPGPGRRYITTDGLHLRKESAARWSADFRRAVQE